jgi:hypothetical protein
MKDFLDEPGRLRLMDLLPNDPTLLLVKAAQMPLHQSGADSDVQVVLHILPLYARHVQGTPCEYLSIHVEEVDKHFFLFGVELGADP